MALRSLRSFQRVAPVAILLALYQAQVCGASQASGSIAVPPDDVVFLTKFCFSFDPEKVDKGSIHITLGPEGNHTWPDHLHLLAFDDEENSFVGPTPEWQSLSCAEREAHAKNSKKMWPGEVAHDTFQIHFNITQAVRPRWWFYALSNCGGQPVNVAWVVHAENPGYGWASELSADRRFAPQLSFGLLVACACLVAAQCRVQARLSEERSDDSAHKKASHPFVRIVLLGTVVATTESMLSFVHWLTFASNGVGAPLASLLAQILGVCANFVLASLLLFLSQGKCVSYRMVSADVWKMVRLLGPCLVPCLFLELWGEHSLSRIYTTDYVYTTPVGWCLIVADLALFAFYLTQLYQTQAAEQSKAERHFYRTWGLVYGAWFVSTPVIACLAQFALAPYAWYIVGLLVKKGGTALVFGSLVLGLWPGNTQSYINLGRSQTPTGYKLPLLPEVVLEECADYDAASPLSIGSPCSLPASQDVVSALSLPRLLGNVRPKFPGVNKTSLSAGKWGACSP